MEHKMDQLVCRGISIMKAHSNLFLKHWNHTKAHLIKKQTPLVHEFDDMIQHSLTILFNNPDHPPKQFCSSLFAEWNNRYQKFEDTDAIFLLSIVESLFQKILMNSSHISFLDRQAVQAFFTRLIDQILMVRKMEDQTEKWLNMVISMNAIPAKWIASITMEENNLKINKVVCSPESKTHNQFIQVCEGIEAKSVSDLQTILIRLLNPGSGHEQILTIPFVNEYILLCTKHAHSFISEENKELLKKSYLRHMKLKHLENEVVWKDSALLFLQSLVRSDTAAEAIQLITDGLVDYLPFNRCALFIYSPGQHSGVGVSGCNIEREYILDIKEEIDQFPLLKKYLSQLNYSKPIHIPHAMNALPETYINRFNLKSLIVVPIFVPTKNRLIGIALLDKGEGQYFEVSTQTLTALIKFGQYAGEVLNRFWDEAMQHIGVNETILSPREIEVMKLMAEGASISDAASRLYLSSYTVRDYVSAIIHKLNARNRTEAAVKAVKMKII
ncbi:LuxR C-terminal-related transcriptional regulator [Peribacillus sp. SCS-155]|uniref:LuxR C-terminal-related transcriptional regulator n=1 Tax=Peribacillus sedimenti TaxID=3115297 RepID=UPI003906B8BA